MRCADGSTVAIAGSASAIAQREMVQCERAADGRAGVENAKGIAGTQRTLDRHTAIGAGIYGEVGVADLQCAGNGIGERDRIRGAVGEIVGAESDRIDPRRADRAIRPGRRLGIHRHDGLAQRARAGVAVISWGCHADKIAGHSSQWRQAQRQSHRQRALRDRSARALAGGLESTHELAPWMMIRKPKRVRRSGNRWSKHCCSSSSAKYHYGTPQKKSLNLTART